MFRFSSESSGKTKIGSLDLLDLFIRLEEVVDDVLTSALGELTGIGVVGMLTSDLVDTLV